MRDFPDAADPGERDTPAGASEAGGEAMRGSAFVKDVRQIDLKIGGELGKVPLFFYDGSYISAAFPARYRALRELMPDPRYVPARLAPGLGVVAVTCFETRDTDVGPYRVVVIAIPLKS